MNPNGLTTEQIAARPRPYIGMIYAWRGVEWHRIGDGPMSAQWEIGMFRHEAPFHRLPGEPGCPWPPPDEFRHEWQEGDRAWVLWNQRSYYGWRKMQVGRWADDDGLVFVDKKRFAPIAAPALYIPEVK